MSFKFPGWGKSGFVHSSSSGVSSSQAVVQRIGNAIIGGDFSGNARGDGAIDIQIAREEAAQVASGNVGIAFGQNVKASGAQAIALGLGTIADGNGAVALGAFAHAAGANAVATGYNAGAVGAKGVSVGEQAAATGVESVAIGYKASATSDYNVVLAGIVLKLQTAVGVYQTMMGQGDAAGGDLTGTYPNPTIAADAVTNTKLANMATQTIKGRTTAGTGDPEDLTAAQVRTILNVTETAFFQFPFHARLTAVSGNPTPTAETSTVSTIYLTPYLGSTIALYDGSNWDLYTLTEISLALSGLTAGKNYDVFVYNNSGTLTLELSAAWTTDTARADALTTQAGVSVKSGATTRRYAGTIRATAANATTDTLTQRYLYNYYNRVLRNAKKSAATSHTYGTAAWRQWNADAANKVEWVVGIAEESVQATLQGFIKAAVANNPGYLGAGLDSTTANSVTSMAHNAITGSFETAFGYLTPGIGYHYLAALEYGDVSDPPTFTDIYIYLGLKQ